MDIAAIVDCGRIDMLRNKSFNGNSNGFYWLLLVGPLHRTLGKFQGVQKLCVQMDYRRIAVLRNSFFSEKRMVSIVDASWAPSWNFKSLGKFQGDQKSCAVWKI